MLEQTRLTHVKDSFQKNKAQLFLPLGIFVMGLLTGHPATLAQETQDDASLTNPNGYELYEPAVRQTAFADFSTRLEHESLRLIVRDMQPNQFKPEGSYDTDSALDKQREDIATSHAAFIKQINGVEQTDPIAINREYSTIPYVALTINQGDTDQLDRVVNSSASGVYVDSIDNPQDDRVNTLINAPSAWRHGATGSGFAMVFLGSGIDYTHPDLSAKIADIGACFSSNTDTSSSLCNNGQSEEIGGKNVAVNCDPSIAACAHETMVAGAGSSVAPDSPVISVKVVSRSVADNGAFVYESDAVKGIDWIMEKKLRISTINYSYGGKEHTSICNSSYPYWDDLLRNVLSYGAVFTTSTGNKSYLNATDVPSCIAFDNPNTDGIIATGSSTIENSDWRTINDRFSNFSNIAWWALALAPGEPINAPYPGGGRAIVSGTSMSAGIESGQAAALRSQFPDMTPQKIESTLLGSGVTIPDTGVAANGWSNGLSGKRTDIGEAVDGASVEQNPVDRVYLPNISR